VNLVKNLLIILVLTGTLFLSGCGDTPNKAAITGIIDHPHRMSLPDGTLIIVRIDDTTRAGAEGKKIAEAVMKSEGDALPMPFAVVYDPGKINPNHDYSVTIRVEDPGGAFLYTNVKKVNVITKGNAIQGIDVVVELAGG